MIDGLFDPVIRRELDDHAAASGWLAPVDLRAIPCAEWDRWLNHRIQLPAGIARYHEGQPAFTILEVQNLEAALEKHHGVTAPYYLTFIGREAVLMKEPA